MPEGIDNIEILQTTFNQVVEGDAPEIDDKSTFSFAELWETKDEEVKFLIDDLLPKQAVAVLVGEDGIGKTQILTQLCLHVCLGLPTFLNLPLNIESKRCLIVATEDSKEKFIRSAAKQAQALLPQVNPKDVLLDFTEGGNFDDMDSLKVEIEKLISVHKYELVILDAFSDLFTLIDGEINSNTHARFIIKVLQNLCKKYGTTIIAIHHVSKTKVINKIKDGKLFIEKGDTQGAGAITQKPRTVLALTHEPKSITENGRCYNNLLHLVKTNLTSKYYLGNAIKVAFDSATLLHQYQEVVNIQLYESNNNGLGPESNATATPNAAQEPQITYDNHLSNMMQTFGLETYLGYNDLTIRMKAIYGPPMNNITKGSTGHLATVQRMGIVVKFGNKYSLSPEIESNKLFKSDAPAGGEDDTPF